MKQYLKFYLNMNVGYFWLNVILTFASTDFFFTICFCWNKKIRIYFKFYIIYEGTTQARNDGNGK